MTKSRRLSSKINLKLNLIIFGIFVSIVSVAFVSVWQDRESTLVWAEKYIFALAQTLAEHAGRSLEAVNLTLLTVTIQAEHGRLEPLGSAEKVIKELDEYIEALPQVSGLILTDDKGVIRYAERKNKIGTDIRDREYYQYLAANPNAGLYIGKPVKGRPNGDWYFSTSRRIENPDGSFDGVTTALVRQSYFNKVYGRVEEKHNVNSAYITDQGLIFATSPSFSKSLDSAYGEVIDFLGNGENAVATHGSYRAKLFGEDVERLISYAKVPNLPVYILTSSAVDQVLTAWKIRSTYLLTIVVILFAVPAGLVVVLKRHLTKRELAESSLHLSEERIRNIVESISNWIWEGDENLRLTYISDRYREITGVDPKDIIGKPIEALATKGKDSGNSKNHFDGILNRKAFRDFVYETKLPSGKHLHFKISGQPIFDEDGIFQGYRGAGTDITRQVHSKIEKKKLEKQLHQAQKMEAIGHLAGGIAHDFNNLLNPIVGYAEMLISTLPMSSEERIWAGRILKASGRAISLIRQIMTFSQRGESVNEVVDFPSIINEVMTLQRSMIPSTIEIHSDVSNSCGSIRGDPVQIHQIIMNLCVNATYALGECGGKISVVLKEFEVDDEFAGHLVDLQPGLYARLSFSDNGCGMDKETTAKIFEPFFTTKVKGTGTGLGLATVHGIVKNHGGCINVYSELGTGTTFQIYLPIIEPTENIEELAETIFEGVGQNAMVVDDEQGNVDMLRIVLLSMGVKATCFTSSLEALAKFEENPDYFDLVITDQTMPDITGAQLIEKIHELRADIPIIMVTGFSASVNAERAPEIGIAYYLSKPLTRRYLSRALKSVIGEKPPIF